MVDEMVDSAGRGDETSASLGRPVDVARATAEAAEACGPAIRERRLTLVCRISPDLAVEGDHDHLVQVLNNVIDNAVKHSTEGGNIYVQGWRSKDRGYIEVRDEGEGIAPDRAPRLFEPAERCLGLSIARALLERHHGSICAESAGPGKGSTFTITLPASPHGLDTSTSTSDVAPERARSELGRRSRRVLVVEDSVEITEMLADALRLEGHEVVVAQDARSAIELSLIAPFDAILIDVHMPTMDGRQLARDLRERLAMQCPLLIGTVACGRTADDDELFDRVLSEPINLHLLLAIVGGRRRRRRRSTKQPRLPR
jgi:CheY-like chemotaxis protein